MLIDGVIVVTEEVPANGNFRIPDKLNLPVNTTLTVNASAGVSVTISYFQQAIDTAAALTVIQSTLQDAVDAAAASAILAENALPSGTIDDSSIGTDSTYSSTKIDSELDLKANKASPIFTGSITEQVAIATDVLSSASGTVQTRTLAADVTFTDALAEGQAMTLLLTNAGYVITYPAVTWFGDETPTLGTTDKLFFEKINGVLYGTHSGTIA